jgi:hypothetical protein
MQATEQKKGELIIELRGKTVTTTIRDITQTGIKIENNDQAQVTGKYNANHMETTTISVKMDGTSDWQSKAIESTPEGDMIVITGGGKGKQTGPTTVAFDGEFHFMTQSPKLSWLNNTTGLVEGTADQAKGEFHAKIYKSM